jgi:hypothetical protein
MRHRLLLLLRLLFAPVLSTTRHILRVSLHIPQPLVYHQHAAAIAAAIN